MANDGMSSKTCSIIVGGKKETIPVNLADAVICGLDNYFTRSIMDDRGWMW